MTEPTSPREGSADGIELDPYSKDYWDIVFEQLKKRRLFQLGLVILALFYGSAIYAPLIANDRPYVLEAVDFSAYDQARRGLYPVTIGLSGLVKKTPDEYLKDRTEGSDQSYEEALAAEEQAVAQRLDSLRKYLPVAHHGLLDEVAETTALVVDSAGDKERAGELGKELKALAKRVRNELEPRRPPQESGEEGAEEAPAEEAEGIELVGQVSYPLRDSITPWEVFFMILWAFVLAWPLWNAFVNKILLRGNRDTVREWRRRKILIVLGTSVLGSLVWLQTIGGEMTFNTAPYKDSLTSGDIIATRVVFPPIPFGFAETNLAEDFRPPTWHATSEINEEGFYVRGGRAQSENGEDTVAPVAKPVEQRFGEPERNAVLRHPLGTDSLGRDLLVRALWGGRVSLAVGIVSTVILMIIGVIIGSIAGYFGAWVDIGISRFIEVVLCFPVFFLILVVVAFMGPSILNIMVIIGLVRWTGVARLTRGEFLKLKEQDFVLAARALGLSNRRIVFRHMLPNAMGPLIVAGTFSVAAGILVESSLSFLGFGIQLPIPSWGSLILESRSEHHWWIQVFPGLLIFATVLCYNLVGDGIRDAMDPRLKT